MSRSPYWQYFSGFGNEVAKCKICDASVKTCGNTTNIARHLREHHPTIFSDLKNGNKCSDPKQPKISQSLDAIKSLNVATNAIDSFEELVSLINSVRKIVTNLKQSCKLMSDLRDERVGSGKEDLKPIQDVITRWNSSYLMIDRYLELRIEISYVLLKHSKRDDDLTDSQVNILKEIVTLLKPLYEMTLDISGEKYVTISRVIPLVVSAITYISTIRVETSIAKRFKLKVIPNLNARFENIENKKVFGLATLLDPRFKKLAFQSETAALANQRAINAMLSEIPTTQIYRLEDSDESSNTSGIWSIYDKKVRNVNVSDGMDSGLLHYLELPVLDRSEDPLEFWRKNKENWPQLHNLAIKYLTLQATSVPSERLFSKTGDIITQKRNRIKPKNVNLLCFLESLPNCYI